jgi:hypothetical protein
MAQLISSYSSARTQWQNAALHGQVGVYRHRRDSRPARFLCAGRTPRYRERMSALPAEHEDPLDPERIMRALPERERETFLAQYRQAVDGAHEPSGWPALRRMLHLWALRTVAVAQPGYYEARDRARAGVSTGGMLLEDAVGQYRPGAGVKGRH